MLALTDDDVELDAVAEGADEDLAQAEADERRQRTVRHRRIEVDAHLPLTVQIFSKSQS